MSKLAKELLDYTKLQASIAAAMADFSLTISRFSLETLDRLDKLEELEDYIGEADVEEDF